MPDNLARQRSGLAGASVVIVCPVLDDWASLSQLIDEAGRLPRLQDTVIRFVVVDDGSRNFLPLQAHALHGPICEIITLKLAANQSHQRAIALGLAYVYQNLKADLVVVMDSDGEDRPTDIERMIEAHERAPDSIIVAQRRKRTESIDFQAGYLMFKLVFGLLTGKSISFGNFSLIPFSRLSNVIFSGSIWNHFAATLLRSRVPIVYLDTDRGTRYFGSSKMNLTSLVAHGMSAVSVFSDLVITRIIMSVFFFLGLMALSVAVVLGAKFVADIYQIEGFFIPGYATNILLTLGEITATSLMIALLAILSLLSSRTNVSAFPTALVEHLVVDVVVACRKEKIVQAS